jgi:hypothetical protein
MLELAKKRSAELGLDRSNFVASFLADVVVVVVAAAADVVGMHARKRRRKREGTVILI